MTSYQTDYQQSLKSPEEFWSTQAKNISWHTFPERILGKDEKGNHRWFQGGKLNTCYLALDYHIENGRGNQAALIYDSPITGNQETYTYRQLLDKVARFAGVLKNLGVGKGDRVVIYMPMIPQTAIAMLACARIGAIHSVVFGGFAAKELALRIDDAQPKVLLIASGGLEIGKKIAYKPIVDEALNLALHKPKACVVFQRPEIEAKMHPGMDHDWEKLLSQAEPTGFTLVDATDPLYILYTSGTTGKPKGIVRDNGGHAVALKYSMEYVYGVQPGEVYWAASDVGWVVGHSYIIYAPLIHGSTTILFEGKPIKTPDAGTFWRIVQEHKVSVLFTAPTAIRAIKKEDPNGDFKKKYFTPTLRYLFLAGERCDVSTYEWAKELLGIEVIDHWWQTESGWAMLANMAGYGLHPFKPGSATKPVPGYDIQILDGTGKVLGPNQEGAVVVKLPLPPGCLPTLWKNEARYQSAYLTAYPGYYLTGDGGYIDEDGYVFITGRIDDVINVAGHRLSTADMEEILAAHPSVAECSVIGIEDNFKGQIPIGLVVLKRDANISPEDLEADLIKAVRAQLGPVASFKKSVIVKRLPKTRSGKILRKTMRSIADGKPYNPPSTIEDPAVLGEITEVMKEGKVGQAFT